MAYAVHHTQVGSAKPHWYLLERWDEGHREQALRRARNYTLDHGGYVYVADHDGNIVYGTNPVDLDRAIARGTNRDFTQTATA